MTTNFPTFTLDCAHCQLLEYQNRKQNKAAILPFSKLSNFFNISYSLESETPINPAFEQKNHYIYVFVDHFNIYIVTVPIAKIIAHLGVNSLN